MDQLTCDIINKNLYAVTYNQYGSNFHDVHQIIGDYWIQADCGNLNPFREDGACFPYLGLLYSYDWTAVIEIQVLSGEYLPPYVPSPSPSTSKIHQHSQNPNESSTLLIPTLLLLICLLIV